MRDALFDEVLCGKEETCSDYASDTSIIFYKFLFFSFLFVVFCADGLSAVNAIGTQLRDPINSGLTRWRTSVS